MSTVAVAGPGDAILIVWYSRIRHHFAAEPGFTATALFILLAMTLPSVLAMQLDSRELYGISVWIKPIKFHLSVAIFLLTLAFYARYLPQTFLLSRPYRLFSSLVVFVSIAEMIWVTGAAMYGLPSHFNTTEPLLQAIYPLMGLFATIMLCAPALYGYVFFRDDASLLHPVMRRSLALGLILTLVLTVPVAGYLASGSGHWVGGNLSDTESIVLTGWATDGGDLRVAHFFATHAMHFIPLAGVLAARWMSVNKGNSIITVICAVYTLLVAGTFVQALMGKPFLF